MPLVIILAIAARWLVKYVLTKTLLFLGIGYVVYSGIDSIFDDIQAGVDEGLYGIPGDAFNIAIMCGIDEWVQIVMGAFAAFLVLKAITQGIKTVMKLGIV